MTSAASRVDPTGSGRSGTPGDDRTGRGRLDDPSSASQPRVGFLGPAGTFTEQALLDQPDLAVATLVPMTTIADVLSAVVAETVDIGFVPIENAIEGTVHATVDSLVFEVDLLVQREAVLDVHLHLMAPPGTTLADVSKVLSFPVATAQCRRFLAEQLPGVEIVPTNSTADAAQVLGRDPEPGTAALAPKLAAELYGLTMLAT